MPADRTRIGVLICDHIDEDLRSFAGGDMDELFLSALLDADPDLDVRFYDAVGGELPQSPTDCDGYILTGSHHSAYEDLQWIEDLSEFIRSAHQQDKRMVGLCFGHQLLAQALGGRVEKAPRWTTGVQLLELSEQPWFKGGPTPLLAIHQDVVTALPTDSCVIGHGTTADIPAYRIGDNVLGLQYHPEFKPEFIEELILRRVDLIGQEASEAALATLRTQTARKSTMDSILRFLRDEKKSDQDASV
jgi:GMP synthase-like glutamine amidotransferase